MSSRPKASSTPKTIKGRPSIRASALIQSPIENKSSSDSEKETSSDEDTENEIKLQVLDKKNRLQRRKSNIRRLRNSSSSYEVTQNKQVINTKELNYGSWLGITALIVVLLGVVYGFSGTSKEDSQVSSLAILQNELSSQQKDFLLNIEVAISEVIHLHQPKSIILLYKDVNTVINIVKHISNYASLQICDSNESFNVSGSYLGREDILEDYGKFIAELKSELDTKCVVIINNLDEVPGTSAQAFHSLCDEYNPVSENVLFLFTLRVDEFPKNTYKYVEKILRNIWSNLSDDKFYPLYTRISIFILPVI